MNFVFTLAHVYFVKDRSSRLREIKFILTKLYSAIILRPCALHINFTKGIKMAENLLKKITVSGMVGKIVAPPVGEYKSLAIMLGHAKGHSPKATTYGESTQFTGDFKGVNTETGEEFRSGVCYLPDVAANLLKGAIDGSEGIVEFAFDIGVVGVKSRQDDDGAKYEFRCKPLMAASENDPMTVLTEKLKSGALAAPKQKALAAPPKPAAKGRK